eukprot:788127-Prymnesium_polylepis.2
MPWSRARGRTVPLRHCGEDAPTHSRTRSFSGLGQTRGERAATRAACALRRVRRRVRIVDGDVFDELISDCRWGKIRIQGALSIIAPVRCENRKSQLFVRARARRVKTSRLPREHRELLSAECTKE